MNNMFDDVKTIFLAIFVRVWTLFWKYYKSYISMKYMSTVYLYMWILFKNTIMEK